MAGIHQDGPGDTWITLFRLGVGLVQDRHQFTSSLNPASLPTGPHKAVISSTVQQTYKEFREDGHSGIFICRRDMGVKGGEKGWLMFSTEHGTLN